MIQIAEQVNGRLNFPKSWCEAASSSGNTQNLIPQLSTRCHYQQSNRPVFVQPG